MFKYQKPYSGLGWALSKRLLKKLKNVARLSKVDEELFLRLCARTGRDFPSRTTIIDEGDKPAAMYVVRKGWACACKTLEDGRRQTVAFFLPGDVCHVSIHQIDRLDHTIRAITPITISQFTARDLNNLRSLSQPTIGALLLQPQVNSATQREWMVNLALRGSLERVAHLICELFNRLESVGLTDGPHCEFPLTQTDLAEALGLTGIHVNRTLQRLRSMNLIVLRNRMLTVPNLPALQRVALFNDSYLHPTSDR